ncbi:MAG: hypothetical protein GX593_09385 [Actinomycetales bacterium]|nr:hypothetical protein [Actinomycetales bacterium]
MTTTTPSAPATAPGSEQTDAAALGTSRPARPRTPLRAHSATLVSVLAVTTSAWALNPLFEPGRWAPVAFVVCLVLGWGTALVRTRSRSALAPTLGGLVLVAYGLAVVYLSPPGELDLLPDGESLDRLGLLSEALSAQVLEGVAPLPVSAALEMVAIGGIAACYLLVELVCFGLRAPAWAGLPLLALWVPAIFVYVDVSALVFVLAAVSYLALLAIASDAPALDEEERRRRNLITAGWATTVAVLTLAVTPLVTALPFWGSNPLPFLGSATPGSILLSADLDMRDSLGRQSPDVALRYRVNPVTPGPLRLRTLRDFDGEAWSAGPAGGETVPAGSGEMLWPGGYDGETEGAAVTRVDVEVVALREDQLPIPTFPRTVEAPGQWHYDAERDEVSGRSRTLRGMTYAMDVVLPWFDADDLRATAVGEPLDVETYLAVPETEHAEDIATRALEVTERASTPYDQALLLQTFLRSRPFEYQTEIPDPVTGDAVWDFLESGQGYCVQFATAMTVMARTLGIPARMAVGFLPGSSTPGTGQRTYEVRGDRAHTWPELHFEGIGWVRFEPTPAVQSGFPPAYADPFANVGEDPTFGGELPTSTAVPSARPTGGTAAGSGGFAESVARTLREAPAWVLVAASLVLVALVAGGVLLARRLRRRVTRTFGPETAWSQLRERLAAIGITWSDSRTPRQVIATVSHQVERRTRAPIDADALRALRALAGAVERTRYAPSAPETTHEELERDVAAVMRGAAVSDPARRDDGPSAPRAST